MLKKFVEGLFFGAGIAAVFLAVLASGIWMLPFKFSATPYSVAENEATPASVGVAKKVESPFHELPLEEQIKKSSVIALARYEPTADGKMKAIVKEFLKRETNTTIYYDIGEEYPSGSFYPKEGTSHGDGLIVFFVDSPTSMRMSMSYSGDRIRSLGDIPLDLFRKKCEANT